jgi:hypothetical protein
MMPICRACKVRPADSAEHIFPSALGGRVTIPNILCANCNNKFGSGVDTAIADAFIFQRLALEVVGDRGQTPQLAIQHPKHGRVYVGSGLRPKLADRKPEKQEVRKGSTLVTTTSDTIARQVVIKATARDSGLQVTAANRRHYSGFDAEIALEIGGEDFYRACMKILLVYIEHHDLIPSATLESAWRFVVDGGEQKSFNICISPFSSPWHLPASMSEFSHQLLFESRADQIQARAALSFFGCPLISIDFAYPATQPCMKGLAYDPFGRQAHDDATWQSVLPSAPTEVVPAVMAAPYDAYLRRVNLAGAARREDYVREKIIKIAMEPLDSIPEGAPVPESVFKEIFERAGRLLLGYQAGEAVTLADPNLLRKLRSFQIKPDTE